MRAAPWKRGWGGPSSSVMARLVIGPACDHTPIAATPSRIHHAGCVFPWAETRTRGLSPRSSFATRLTPPRDRPSRWTRRTGSADRAADRPPGRVEGEGSATPPDRRPTRPSGWRSSAPALMLSATQRWRIAASEVNTIGRKQETGSCTAHRRAGGGASTAKSTIMMAFFLTMPISMTMPIMAITERSSLKSWSVSSAPITRHGAGEDGERMDEARRGDVPEHVM